MIGDEELREVFRAECAEHLQLVEHGLLRFERAPQSVDVEEIFRAAHSLKGAARMIGLHAIEELAHGLESALGNARRGGPPPDAAQLALLLGSVDRLRALVAEATGDAQPAATPDASAAPTPAAPAAPPAMAAPAGDAAAEFRIDTLRIESHRLDSLLQLASELVVGKGRIARWQGELDALAARCESAARRGEDADTLDSLAAAIERTRSGTAADLARLESITHELETGIRRLRLLPFGTLLDLLPRMVHDLCRTLGKQVECRIGGAATVADKRIVEEMKAPLTHILRNCIDHGIETPEQRRAAGKPEEGLVVIAVEPEPDALRITVSDDGRGLDVDAIRAQALRRGVCTAEELRQLDDAQLHALVLQPGFSTSRTISEVSGRGVGLDVVRTTVERLRGSLQIDSRRGCGTTLTLRLPVSVTATRALLVREWGETYALPFDAIAFLTRLGAGEIHAIEGRRCFRHDGRAIAIGRLGALLGRHAPAADDQHRLHCVALQLGNETFALALDEVLAIEDLVVKPVAAPLIRVRNVAGLAVLDSGAVCAVLNPYDLLRAMNRNGAQAASAAARDDGDAQRRILLVEDSITTRQQERRILEAAGYAVDTAVDGLDAWNRLAAARFDAVVSDVEMPRMTGLELAERMRATPRHATLPLILVTTLTSEEDRRRGLEVGADAYFGKSEFDQRTLLDCIERLLSNTNTNTDDRQ